MFTFEDVQIIQPASGRALLSAASISLRFLPKGQELQLLHAGTRELSVTINSKPFIYTFQTGDHETTIGFGHIKKPESSLRVSLGGKFQSLAANEDINPIRLPSVEIPTLLVFIQKPFTTEKALCGVQFMGQIDGREIPVEVDDWASLDSHAFRDICERFLGLPKEY